MPSLFSNIKTYLLVLIVSVLVGFFLGKSFQQKIIDAKSFKEQQVTETQSNASILASNEVEKKTLDTQVQIQTKYKYITKEIIKYVPATEVKTCVDNEKVHNLTLSVDAVRMLNGETLQSGEVQPTPDRITEGQALTEVGLRELSEYIATCKQQYEELANNHNGLVDYDNWYLQQVTPKP